MKATGILEYTRKCRIEGARLARIAFFCVLYAFVALLWLAFSILSANIAVFILLGAIAAGTFAVTKPFLTEQRDYEILDGNMRIYKIYGNSFSKKAFECDISDMIEIAPYDPAREIREVVSVKDLLSDSRSSDAYYAIYENNGKRYAVIFDGDDKFRAAASFYCRRAFRAW